MILKIRSVAIVVATAGYAHAAAGADEKSAQLLIASVPASAWTRPALVTTSAAKAAPALAGLLPVLPSSYFGTAQGSSRLLFLSPLSPLRAALRVAAQDLASHTLTAFDAGAGASIQNLAAESDTDPEAAAGASGHARRREVLLRQRRRSVLNERDRAADHSKISDPQASDLELTGLNGQVELLALPSGARSAADAENSIPGGSGLVRVSGYLSDDLSFALTGLAADSAATTWRAGAEFELAEGDRNTTEIGAVYGSRFNASSAPVGGEVDRRSVGAFRLVHAVRIFDGVTVRAGGRVMDAPFLRSSRSADPEFSVLLKPGQGDRRGKAYLRLDARGDTLFPGLEVVTGASDVIALSEGLPVFARDFKAQRTWSQSASVGYQGEGTRLEARIQDQSVNHALLVLPFSVAGASLVGNGSRNRVQTGSVLVERTFAHGQGQGGIEYAYGRFAADALHADRVRDFRQITTRFDAYLRRTGTGIAIFHRFHDGASVTNYEGEARPRIRQQRYLLELRQDVPFVPSMIGADMALLLSLRNVYYDDVDRRSLDEFAVQTPPRRITGGIRVKF